MNSALNLETFHTLDTDPGGTLQRFDRYTERIKLLFDLVFRKADGSPYAPSDKEKKSMLLFKGGDDMATLFNHVGRVLETDTFDAAITKIRRALSERTNKVVQRNLLLTKYPQGNKSFEKWSVEISNAAQLIDYTDYNWKTAAVDAIILQTSSNKLREKALQEHATYDSIMEMGIVNEQSAKGAAMLTKNNTSVDPKHQEEEVRKLQQQNEQLRKQLKGTCYRCGKPSHAPGKKCPANGKTCAKCKKLNHFAEVCRSSFKKQDKSVRQLYQSDSEEDVDRILEVKKLSKNNITAKIYIQAHVADESQQHLIKFATDTGVRKTLLNKKDWLKIKDQSEIVETSKRFRPYGTSYHLPIIGRTYVHLIAERGATIKTWVYILDSTEESSLLGEEDAIRLGIVSVNLQGATEEVIQTVTYQPSTNHDDAAQLEDQCQHQSDVDHNMDAIKQRFSGVFTHTTGKFIGEPIKIQVNESARPVIAPRRRIPLHYVDRVEKELDKMLQEDIIEGPLTQEEKGTFISNLVITDKKGTDRIRVTLDCQEVNKHIYATHEPIPTSEELRHQLKGSDRFSKLDMTNCYYQFEIEESARKLFAFRSTRGILRFKRMVMGTSPASSEIQKKIRETVSHLPNVIHIKDDLIVHGKGKKHDEYLINLLTVLEKKGLTLRPDKCELGKTSIIWFGHTYSKHGMSPEKEKCQIIKDWKAPQSVVDVKSFLQTVQFNAKFMTGNKGEPSYPELTAPLRNLTKKNSRFKWTEIEETAFQKLKDRISSNSVVVPFDTKRETRLYVDSSFAGTQATVAQKYCINNKEYWRPVNHSSRVWTPTEANYSQMERESKGILTGMHMNKMYTQGNHVEVVTDHLPLVAIYNDISKPRPLRVDRHRTKFLSFDYHVVYESGKYSPCDYGSRHPSGTTLFSEQQKEQWCIENGEEILVNRIVQGLVPSAITIQDIKDATSKDQSCQKLIEDVTKYKSCRAELGLYKGIFNELSVVDGILLREDRVIIPSLLQADIIQLAHECHMGIDKTVKLIRETCWFPNMHSMVSDYVNSCIGCQAAIPNTPPVPLQPNFMPERPWQKLHADFKGPIGAQYYLHIVIDQYSKFPEVDILKSTRFEHLKPRLDRILATHGVPESLTTDNGPPDDSDNMRSYAKEMGFKLTPVTAKDPQCNGFAENFVKTVCKLIHTCCAENKDPRQELHMFLMNYRATPHLTTGRSPAEMLFGRRLRTKLPQYPSYVESEKNANARLRHDQGKLKQKDLFDKHHRASDKKISVGDQILIKQQKSTTKPPFRPQPLIVQEVKGNKVTATDGNITRKRDKNQVKVVPYRPAHLQSSVNCKSKPKTYNQQSTSYSSPIYHNKINQPTIQQDGNSESTRDNLFSLEPGATAELTELINTAEARLNESNNIQHENEGRVLRSQGLKLQWNRNMNDPNVVEHSQ